MTHAVIPHTKPTLGPRERAAVRRVLMSGMINDGAQGGLLVNTVAQSVGAAGGVVTSTGSHAIFLALKALGINGPDHKVAIPDFSCRAVYDAIRMSGATVVFLDVDDTGTCGPQHVAPVAHMVSAVVLPHLFGQPADAPGIVALGVPVVEDCAHSPGATIDGRPVGSFGRFAAFSFEGSKYVTAGEGGVVVATNPNDAAALVSAKMGGVSAAQCRLADIVSAVALEQWKRLPSFIARRKALARRYHRHLDFSTVDGEITPMPPGRPSIFYRYTIQIDGSRRDAMIAVAEAKGVLIRHPIRSGPLSLYLPGIAAGRLDGAEKIDKRIVSLPIYPSLTNKEQERVIEVFNGLAKGM